jgi:choline-sulfatase
MPTDRPPPAEPRESPLGGSSETPPPAPLFAQLGSLLGAGTLAALLASGPAAIRVAHDGGGPLRAWIALGACSLLPMIAAIAFARSARGGARSIAGEDAPLAAWGIAVWAMTTFLALAAYGALLRATTHHHGLAGVTFALGGLTLGGALALVTRRLMQMARGADPWGRAALVTTTIGALLCALLVVVIRVARAGGGDLPSATLVDVLAFAIAAGALSREAFARVAWLAIGGFPLALGVLALGWALLSQEPALIEAIQGHAPVFAAAAIRMAGLAGAR